MLKEEDDEFQKKTISRSFFVSKFRAPLSDNGMSITCRPWYLISLAISDHPGTNLARYLLIWDKSKGRWPNSEFLTRFCAFFIPSEKKSSKIDFSSLSDKFFPKAEFQYSKSGFRGCRNCRGHNLEHSNVKGTRYRTKESPIQHQKWKKVP